MFQTTAQRDNCVTSLHYLERARELAEKLESALKQAEYYGSDANALSPLEDVQAYIKIDIEEANDMLAEDEEAA